jgi:hypothetical protein
MVNPQLLSELVMTLPLQKTAFPAPIAAGGQITSTDSMAYMGDLLENMRKIAHAHGLGVLAHLLELARVETRLVIRDHPPGLQGEGAQAGQLAGN